MLKKAIIQIAFQPPKDPLFHKDENFMVIRSKYGDVIPCYYFRSSNDVKTTLVYCHGNSGKIDNYYKFFKYLRNVIGDINIMIIEYIGFEGLVEKDRISEETTYESIEAGIHYLIKDVGIGFGDIILYGYSIGSGPAVHFCCQKRFRGLILEAPIASILSVWGKSLNRIFHRKLDMFLNRDKIKNVRCPVMIMHGKNDKRVKLKNSTILWKRIPEQFRYKLNIVDKAGHCDVTRVMGYKTYKEELLKFFFHCKEEREEEMDLNILNTPVL